ncbi:uncharacterized protein [Blastocystis hominis]|uniref:Kri1-like C-terminal domain-containing protein n=1 Tax=Blastocystis hominis TaxID=12968 RepID=D8LYP0_BLAHO|nr:uncharacterized protein [Blastocystis hominis]CBK20695.2 unnamed protein product [Blastocystis hominis]|eukprot:XP_012894743.1 uncharacterized protein [Blastocystis hominis]
MGESDDDEDFFTKRDVPEEEQDKFAQYLEENADEEMKKNVQNYLQATPEDEKERFLLDYIKNMRWKGDGDDFDLDDGHMDVESTKATKDVDLDEDIKDIDQQDRYEYLFNTRYEQENIISYPRNIEGSMRRSKDKRKQEREAKKLYPFL